ncbi:MAG TPA: DedA family protein [Gemmatimonadaceae bacterium]|jgi:membrane protein DedA with SNARE-associated domain|nr:DedA family protein [Gemmatimonadaceae bacterium]
MPDFTHHFVRLLHTYTYPGVLSLVMLESLGIPLPGEIALVTAAAYAGVAHNVSISGVILMAAIGATVGGILGYWIGIKGGLPLLARYGGYVGVRRSHIAKAHSFFENNGAKTILFGRFVAVLRTWAAVIAGAACMSFKQFVAYNTLGSIVWSIVFGWLGYYFGRDLPLLERYISRASLGILVAVLVGIVAWLIIRRRRGSGQPLSTPDTPAGDNVSREIGAQ